MHFFILVNFLKAFLCSQTASLLTFLVYMLSQHPEASMKLRAEIMEIVPEGAPTFENIRNMKYRE